MRRYLALALACVLAAISVSALAMGLGEIRLNSYLNQRLDAEIELVSAAADEQESLEIRLADQAAFERVGLDRIAFLNNLQFRVVRRPNGTAYVHVTSTEPVREPFLSFLVEADWSRGRLLREYTLLIDPPTFAGEGSAQAPSAQAPVVTPIPAIERPSADVRQAAPVVEQPRVVEEPQGDVISIPPLEADAEPVAPVRRGPEATEHQYGGNYGPIQRNETLWGIAQRLRPDETITVNQMMLALFRANPEAFQGNINRMKAGYILRIPEFNEISGQSRADAFREVKRQNEEWRAGKRPVAPAPADYVEPAEAEPALSLVAPQDETAPEGEAEAEVGTGAGDEPEAAGTAPQDPLDQAEGDDAGVADLGVEDETPDRLLDLEDESMQALQEQDEGLSAEEPADSSELPPPLPQEEVTSEPVPAETTPPVEEADGPAPREDTAPAEDTAQQQPAPAAAPVERREPALIERLTDLAFSPLGMGIAAAILVLLLAGFLVVRKRREAAQTGSAVVMSDWNDEEADDVTIVSRGGHDEDDVTVVTGRGFDEDAATQFVDMDIEDTGSRPSSRGVAATRSGETDFSQTLAGDQPVTLDENDPLSEADFHMAYGLYDQAAEVVEKAAEREPARKDYQAKLAEIYFAANNTSGFLEAAQRLHELAGPGDSLWDNVAIMGRQIAPDNDLFADGGSTSAVDLDFTTADAEFSGEETVVKPEPVKASDDDLDFDISIGSDDEPAITEQPRQEAVAQEAADNALDLELDVGGTDDTAGTGNLPMTASDDDSDFDFDLGSLDLDASEDADATAETPSSPSMRDDEETQTEFDKALQELSAFVDTNLPEQDAGDAMDAGGGHDAVLNLDEYSFDEDAGEQDEDNAGIGEDEDDIGEIGTKLDLARAYIDMGDPDGARGILEEVLSDGDADQQKEARELLDQLP